MPKTKNKLKNSNTLRERLIDFVFMKTLPDIILLLLNKRMQTVLEIITNCHWQMLHNSRGRKKKCGTDSGSFESDLFSPSAAVETSSQSYSAGTRPAAVGRLTRPGLYFGEDICGCQRLSGILSKPRL